MMASAGALILVSLLSSSLCHPYGPPASSSHHQKQQASVSSYQQSSGNDQLRFHPEESQYFSNEQEPTNHAAPSYADLVNLSTQEAQQQAIIDAQKKLEANKILKDIEFIQKQQDMLQAQIHQQEMKNEQKLNNPGSYSPSQNNPGSTGPKQNNPQGTFSSGQWSPDGNANKFDDGLYKGEGSHNKAAPNDGSYACDGGCTDKAKLNAQKSNFQHSALHNQQSSFQQQSSSQQNQQSATHANIGYGGGPSPGQPQSGGFPEFQSPEYPSPPSPTLPSKPSGSYGGSPNPAPFPPKPTGSYGGSPSPQFPPQQSQFPTQQQTPSKPSYGGGSYHQQQNHHQEQQSQQLNGQEYWWNGPNSPFSPNQLGNCNHLDCSPPAINKPPPPKPGYGPTPSGPPPPPPQSPPNYAPPVHPPPPSGPAEPVNIPQNPYLSGALNGKPLGPSAQPPSYGPNPQSPPSSYGPTPTEPVYPPSQEPYEAPLPNAPQENPQRPFPTKPSYMPSPPSSPTFPSPTPSFPLTNPDSPAGGYGSSGGGTPGVSFPEYQPSDVDVQRVPCTQAGHTCVAKHLCVNGKVNNNGIGIIQLRITMKTCRADIEVCCKEQDSPSPSASYGQAPQSGNHQTVDSYGQPTDSYESCKGCSDIEGPPGIGGSYSHQQSHHSEESASYHHKESSSASVSHGASLPRAQLPDFVPPSATATLPLLKQSGGARAGGYGK